MDRMMEYIYRWTGWSSIYGWTGWSSIYGWTGWWSINGWTGWWSIYGWTGWSSIYGWIMIERYLASLFWCIKPIFIYYPTILQAEHTTDG